MPNELYGVKISDEALKVEPEENTNKANIHDNIKMDTQETKAIEVNPKDTIYNNIKVNDGELQTEIVFAKLRWNKNNTETAPAEDKKVYDNDTKTVGLSNKKVIEMRSNMRVKVVDPDLDDDREIKRDNLKIKIKETYEEYIEKHCNKNGEIKDT